MSTANDEVAELAARHGLPADAVAALIEAIRRGRGRQAQFDHPALGGMGQWSDGGGIMLGDMYNHALKAKVDRLCRDLARGASAIGEAEPPCRNVSSDWWPADLGTPSSVGSQNDRSYAIFPEARRLAIRTASGIDIFDTAGHHISGAAQHEGSGANDLVLTSRDGSVRLLDLERLGATDKAEATTPAAAAMVRDARTTSPTGAEKGGADILDLLERLFDLQRRGVLSAEEFTAKKAELLARL